MDGIACATSSLIMSQELVIDQATKPEIQHTSVRLPFGLLGFERAKNFQLISDPEDSPFQWFKMTDTPNQGFLVLEPHHFIQDYSIQIPSEDVEVLKLDDPKDALILNIITVRPNHASTANLKGPILINRNTLVGKQIIPLNAAQLSVNHPLPH